MGLLPRKPPMALTRANRGTPAANRFARWQARLFRWTKGRLFDSFFGAPILVLTTTGRRSGEPRSVPLIRGQAGDGYVVIASNGGHPDHPPWFRNLQASPYATVTADGRDTPVVARIAEGEERARLFAMMNEVYPGFDDYQEDADRRIPVVVLEPTDRRADR